jgi:hypothetical protein
MDSTTSKSNLEGENQAPTGRAPGRIGIYERPTRSTTSLVITGIVGLIVLALIVMVIFALLF